MGEMVVSARSGDELSAIGLGSCIGLVLVDRQACVAGLAHIVLPESLGADGPAGKFADLAVPELMRRVEHAGARRRRTVAVMVGGARMFALGLSNDIGARNAEAVKDELSRLQLPIHAEDTGGNRGRTARIVMGHSVSVQLAGGPRMSLLDLDEGDTAPESTFGLTSVAGAGR